MSIGGAPPVLVLGGPTAAGKTDAAIEIARRFDAVIVSADAMQVYRGMDIGTGKVTAEQRAVVPHFGLDLVEPDEPFDAAAFVGLADEVIAGHPRVVVAGGTSLYLRALLVGLVETPSIDPELRQRLEALADPHAELQRVDPALAERLHPHDRVRIVRGLEVFHQTGQRLSELHDAHKERVHKTQGRRLDGRGLWLDRGVDELDERIERRVGLMIEQGYVQEVQRLLAAGYGRELKPMLSLGYRHLCDHVLDGLPLEEASRRTVRDTRRFARKQRTWNRTLGFPRVEADELDTILREAEALWG
jgi:tRNA dimethylallyltransferase